MVSGEPNQTIKVEAGPISGIVVINEQTRVTSTDGQSGEILLNALRLSLTDSLTGTTLDVVLASAHSDTVCPDDPPTAPPTDDPPTAPPTDGPPSVTPPDTASATGPSPSYGAGNLLFVLVLVPAVGAFLLLRPLRGSPKRPKA